MVPKGAFLWGDPSSDQWSKICLDHGASKEPASAFLWGDPSSDHWSKICLDHGASKEPANPLWSRIRRFLWCTMIQTDLGSLIRTRITSKERTRQFLWCTMIQTDLGSLIRTRITPKERTLSKPSLYCLYDSPLLLLICYCSTKENAKQSDEVKSVLLNYTFRKLLSVNSERKQTYFSKWLPWSPLPVHSGFWKFPPQ